MDEKVKQLIERDLINAMGELDQAMARINTLKKEDQNGGDDLYDAKQKIAKVLQQNYDLLARKRK